MAILKVMDYSEMFHGKLESKIFDSKKENVGFTFNFPDEKNMKNFIKVLKDLKIGSGFIYSSCGRCSLEVRIT